MDWLSSRQPSSEADSESTENSWPACEVGDEGHGHWVCHGILQPAHGQTRWRGRACGLHRLAGQNAQRLDETERAGLGQQIETRTCKAESLGVEDLIGQMDFVLAFAVVHETPEPGHFIKEVANVLKTGGRLLIAEPKGHVPGTEFRETVTVAENAGLRIVDTPRIARSHAVLMEKR